MTLYTVSLCAYGADLVRAPALLLHVHVLRTVCDSPLLSGRALTFTSEKTFFDPLLCFEGGLPKHENTKHRPLQPAQNTKTRNYKTQPSGEQGQNTKTQSAKTQQGANIYIIIYILSTARPLHCLSTARSATSLESTFDRLPVGCLLFIRDVPV